MLWCRGTPKTPRGLSILKISSNRITSRSLTFSLPSDSTCGNEKPSLEGGVAALSSPSMATSMSNTYASLLFMSLGYIGMARMAIWDISERLRPETVDHDPVLPAELTIDKASSESPVAFRYGRLVFSVSSNANVRIPSACSVAPP